MPVQTDSFGFLTSFCYFDFPKKVRWYGCKSKTVWYTEHTGKEDGYGGFTVMAAPNAGGLPLYADFVAV